MKFRYVQTWSNLLGEPIGDIDYWTNKNRIPIGTLQPYHMYEGEIPDEEIVSLPYDPVSVNTTSRKPFNVLMLGASGDQKCARGHVKVLTSEGKYVRIDELPVEGRVMSLSMETLKLEPKPYKCWKNQGTKPCYEVKTKFGAKIEMSADHPVLTSRDEWKHIEDLEEGDFIANIRRSHEPNKTISIPRHHLAILAYMIADGGVTHGGCNYTKAEGEFVAELREAVEKMGCQMNKLRSSPYGYSISSGRNKKPNHVKDLLEDYGVQGKKSIEKTIPEEVFQLNNEDLAFFLNRLWSSDGHFSRVKNRDKYRYSMGYSTGSEEMARQLKRLLLRFGILACLYSRTNRQWSQERDYWYLGIQNTDNIKTFLERIGLFGKKAENATEWHEDLYALKGNTNFDVTPIYHEKRYLGRERARLFDEVLASSDLFWDRVKSVTYQGEHETWDLCVEDNENFIAEDIVVHNSLVSKIAWYVLQKSGYYCAYIDAKSTDAGRARIKWGGSPRLPPKMEPEGIVLGHFMPAWAQANYEHLIHHFRVYSNRLWRIHEREMLQGLGMSSIGASKVAKLIQRKGESVSMDYIKTVVSAMDSSELPSSTYDNVIRTLVDLEDYEVVSPDYPELDMLREWEEGRSVVISYNSTSRILMTFDIGLKIRQAARYYFTHGNQKPIMFFFDDASYYAQEHAAVKYNFATEQIKEIGFNYRSLGVYNWLNVQSLGIIDEDIAETYRIKLISPKFQNPDALAKINVPRKAINYLKDGVLVRDNVNHILQWMLVDEDNEVVPFFPFTPPSNHFTEIYHPRRIQLNR